MATERYVKSVASDKFPQITYDIFLLKDPLGWNLILTYNKAVVKSATLQDSRADIVEYALESFLVDDIDELSFRISHGETPPKPLGINTIEPEFLDFLRSSDKTPLQKAILKNDKVNILKYNSAESLNTTNSSGIPTAFLVLRYCTDALFKSLVKHGLKLTEALSSGSLPVDYAREHNKGLVKFILKQSAGADDGKKFQFSWKNLIDREIPFSVIEEALAGGAPPDGAPGESVPPIRSAIIYDRPDIVAALINAGANVNFTIRYRSLAWTPLQEAVGLQRTEIIEILKAKGAKLPEELELPPHDPSAEIAILESVCKSYQENKTPNAESIINSMQNRNLRVEAVLYVLNALVIPRKLSTEQRSVIGHSLCHIVALTKKDTIFSTSHYIPNMIAAILIELMAHECDFCIFFSKTDPEKQVELFRATLQRLQGIHKSSDIPEYAIRGLVALVKCCATMETKIEILIRLRDFMNRPLKFDTSEIRAEIRKEILECRVTHEPKHQVTDIFYTSGLTATHDFLSNIPDGTEKAEAYATLAREAARTNDWSSALTLAQNAGFFSAQVFAYFAEFAPKPATAKQYILQAIKLLPESMKTPGSAVSIILRLVLSRTAFNDPEILHQLTGAIDSIRNRTIKEISEFSLAYARIEHAQGRFVSPNLVEEEVAAFLRTASPSYQGTIIAAAATLMQDMAGTDKAKSWLLSRIKEYLPTERFWYIPEFLGALSRTLCNETHPGLLNFFILSLADGTIPVAEHFCNDVYRDLSIGLQCHPNQDFRTALIAAAEKLDDYSTRLDIDFAFNDQAQIDLKQFLK